MPNDTVLALCTGLLSASAALAGGWITSLGNIRVTRVKTAIEAEEMHAEKLRESRRTAYANYIEYVERMKWLIIAAMSFAIDGDGSGLREFQTRRNDMVGDLCRYRIAAILSGPQLMEACIYELDNAALALLGTLEGGISDVDAGELEAHLTPAMVRLNEERRKFLMQAQAVLGAT